MKTTIKLVIFFSLLVLLILNSIGFHNYLRLDIPDNKNCIISEPNKYYKLDVNKTDSVSDKMINNNNQLILNVQSQKNPAIIGIEYSGDGTSWALDEESLFVTKVGEHIIYQQNKGLYMRLRCITAGLEVNISNITYKNLIEEDLNQEKKKEIVKNIYIFFIVCTSFFLFLSLSDGIYSIYKKVKK
jgi:hypothetical protein